MGNLLLWNSEDSQDTKDEREREISDDALRQYTVDALARNREKRNSLPLFLPPAKERGKRGKWYNTKSETKKRSKSVPSATPSGEEEELVMKLSYLESRIALLYQIQCQITSTFEIKNHKDFKMQSKKEQATIMEMVDMMNDLRNLSPEYYKKYTKQNKWATGLMAAYDNKQFDAFE